MPGFDRSGPMGIGPMTGGRRGQCSATDRVDEGAYAERFARGRGYKRGRFFSGGYGRGLGGRGREGVAPLQATSSPDELEYLTQEAQNLEINLQTIKKRIDDLQQKSK